MSDEHVPAFFKDPSIAAVLSFFVPGSGQVYNNEIAKGVGCVGLMAISVLLVPFGIGIITAPALWIWAMIDARDSARRINTVIARRLSHAQRPPPAP